MLKKLVIAGLTCALLIEKLKHWETRKRVMPKIPVEMIDEILYHTDYDLISRMAFKIRLNRLGLIGNEKSSFRRNSDSRKRIRDFSYFDDKQPRIW